MTIVCVQRERRRDDARRRDSRRRSSPASAPPQRLRRDEPASTVDAVDARARGATRRRGAQQDARCAQLRRAGRRSGPQRLLHGASWPRPASTRRPWRARGVGGAAVHDQGGADRRPGRAPPWGSASPSRSSAYTRYTRPRRRPAGRCAGSTPTTAGSGRSSAGRRCSRRPASAPATACCSPFSFGPFLGFWTAFEAGCQIGAHCVPGGGMTSQQRLAPDRRGAAHRPLLHADLRAAPGRSRRRPTAAHAPLHGQRRADDHRRRRVRRQPAGDPRPHRARLGRARHRSLRPDRGRPGRLRGLGAPRRPLRERGGVHRRGHRRGTARPVARRRAGRAGPDQPRTHGEPGDPLPYRATWCGARTAPLRLRPAPRGWTAASSPAPTTW